MKQQKIYEFTIDRPLTPARRKAVEKHIEQNAHLLPRPISWAWEEGDDEVLHITAEPVEVEIKFQRKTVQLFAAAPIWARMLFTRQRKAELKEQIESVLQKAKFIEARKTRKLATRKAPKSAPGKIKKATAGSRNRSAARA
jgi:hypothetical protein